MIAQSFDKPWKHWIVDDFVDSDTLAEIKSIDHLVEQAKPGNV